MRGISGIPHRVKNNETPVDFSAHFRPTAVHRCVYVDPAIFEIELTRIFERSWIYVGHESQVADRKSVV